MTACVAMVWLREQASCMRLLGIALSIVGVLVVFAEDTRSSGGAAAGLVQFADVRVRRVLGCVYVARETSRAIRFDRRHDVRDDLRCTVAAAVGRDRGVEPGLPHPGPNAWLGAAYLGVFASGLGYLLYNYSLKQMAASQVGVFTNLIPIVGVLTGVIALGEPLSWQAILGGLIVMVGVALTTKG